MKPPSQSNTINQPAGTFGYPGEASAVMQSGSYTASRSERFMSYSSQSVKRDTSMFPRFARPINIAK